MNLTEWKNNKVAQLREDVKQDYRDGIDIEEHFAFTTEELEEIKTEAEVEDYAEMHEDWEEVSLEEELTESSELQEVFEFIPSSHGRATDIEAEIDLDQYDISEEIIQRIADLYFAESFEVIVEGSMAKIVFKRSKGEVFKKKKCGKGMRLVGNKCLPQTGTQKAGERRRGIKLKRAFRAMGAGKKKKAQIKKKITSRRVKGRARNLANTVN